VTTAQYEILLLINGDRSRLIFTPPPFGKEKGKKVKLFFRITGKEKKENAGRRFIHLRVATKKKGVNSAFCVREERKKAFR